MSVDVQTVGGKYTEQVLTKNFTAIGKEFENISKSFANVGNWQRHMEGHLDELYDLVDRAVTVAKTAPMPKPKGVPTKYKVVLGVVAGIYIGKKVMTREFNEKLEKAKKEAKEQFDNFVDSQQNNTPDRGTVVG